MVGADSAHLFQYMSVIRFPRHKSFTDRVPSGNVFFDNACFRFLLWVDSEQLFENQKNE